jgi:acyl-CoA reductase-like NAD-dependent aldehyde dehydrogenase
VGKIIAQRAAARLKPVLLELGGKAPFLVLEDADLDEAVKAAAFGAFMNQGQICMSTERIIVVDAVAEAFVEKFRAKAATLVAGDPAEGKAPLGAVISAKAVSHILGLVDDAVSQGAVQLTGDAGDGLLVPAIVVDKVTPAMKLFRDESFGPVVAVIRARDEAHAITLANDTQYGLSAAVFTRDVMRGMRVARQIKSGICHINGPTVHDEAQMPFGGVKASGYGRFGGKAGIEAFTELRWMTVESQPGQFPI